MNTTLLRWLPRLCGISLALGVATFALDALPGMSTPRAIGGFVLHLVPSFMVLGVVFLAWRRPWFGAMAFLLMALLYAASALAHPSWILTISGPLLICSLSYAMSWRTLRPPAEP